MDNDDILSPVIGRRQILRSASALGLLGLLNPALKHLAPRPEGDSGDVGELDPADFADLADDARYQAMCILTPSQTAGPYYLNLNLLRTDITEGQAGIPCRTFLHVVRASDCTPIQNATVDIWHANAPGTYSGFANQGTQGQTWLRGVQITDAAGSAYFDTIYPGWYPGRTTHIHLKVRPTGGTELTTQLYFNDSMSKRLYRRQPYASHGQNPTTNAMDGLFLPETVMSYLGVQSGRLWFDLTIGVA
jgi:intradiol ring-cleaving dioxygenase-like protein